MTGIVLEKHFASSPAAGVECGRGDAMKAPEGGRKSRSREGRAARVAGSQREEPEMYRSPSMKKEDPSDVDSGKISLPREYAVPLGLGLPIRPDTNKVLLAPRPRPDGDFVAMAGPRTLGGSIAETQHAEHREQQSVGDHVLYIDRVPGHRVPPRHVAVDMNATSSSADDLNVLPENNSEDGKDDIKYVVRGSGTKNQLCSLWALAFYSFCILMIVCGATVGIIVSGDTGT